MRAIRALLLAVVVNVCIVAPVYAFAPAASVTGRDQQISHGVWLPLTLILALALITMPAIKPKSVRRWRK